jgi:histidyl-tRNA synthetase
VGWALGMERLLELLKTQGVHAASTAPDAFAVVTDKNFLPDALRTLEQLRGVGVAVQLHASADGTMASMKSQFKKADASGARYALVFGADEMAGGNLSIKDLRNASTLQRTVAMADWAQWAQSLQSGA